jgi:hypothetical protein
MKYDDSFLRNVLELCNQALNVSDMLPLQKLPNGLRNDENFCPLANALDALGARVSCNFVRFNDEEVANRIANAWGTSRRSPKEVILPFILQEFIRCFDLGEFPRFVLNASEAIQGEVAA